MWIASGRARRTNRATASISSFVASTMHPAVQSYATPSGPSHANCRSGPWTPTESPVNPAGVHGGVSGGTRVPTRYGRRKSATDGIRSSTSIGRWLWSVSTCTA